MIIFVCGVPASGKSIFGKFLKDKYGYFYIDMENSPWPDEEIHRQWNTIFSPDENEVNIRNFVDSLEQKAENTVLDLGFPINDKYFWIVPLLKKNGCRIVWFACKENVARKRYLERDGRPIEWFNTQMTNIKNNWGKIKEEINPVKVNVLKPDKSSKTKEELFEKLTKLKVINYV